MANEFTSNEMKDALATSILPPMETIVANNQRQVESLTSAEHVSTFQVTPTLKVDT
jgi:hypothetical protein